MFKTKDTKRIELLEKETGLLLESIKLECEARNLENSKLENKIEQLQKQSECGFTHRAVGEIKEGDTFYVYDSSYGNVVYAPQCETCKICGKKLKEFNNSIEADRRKAELLEIEAKEIKENCNKIELENNKLNEDK